MLTQLTISNFAIVRELAIDFRHGMTAITGETGAGKSIAIDALNLCLGGRADVSMVRPGTQRADICAGFQIRPGSSAYLWLEENHLENGNDCLIRRVVGSDGRSRGFINGVTVPVAQLRELGQLLIQVHGQHAHQLLLKNEHQRSLLDAYANNQQLLGEMSKYYQQWRHSRRMLEQHQQQLHERAAQNELLQYQLKELDTFAPKMGEYELIEEEHKRLANGGQILTSCQQALQLISDSDDTNLVSLLSSARHMLTELSQMDNKLNSALSMLEDAAIQISEACDELRHYSDSLDIDPGRLDELEQRLSRQINLARKHQISPEELPDLHQKLLLEQEKVAQQNSDQDQWLAIVNEHHLIAQETAQRLHESRTKAAQEMEALITHSIQDLSMPHGQFCIEVSFTPEQLTTEGSNNINFRVSTNPGQPLHSLTKVASGGELSRIALAIQLITAQKMETPALIFDEVDVGISGPTAAMVGQLLRQLGESTQVMCVTHLPQVAGCGHNHFFVSKITDGQETETNMLLLDKRERLQELARLLGGSEITRHTLANAKELLAS